MWFQLIRRAARRSGCVMQKASMQTSWQEMNLCSKIPVLIQKSLSLSSARWRIHADDQPDAIHEP